MSMGKWAEDAQVDELELIRQAVQTARERREQEKADKSDILAELQTLADKVLPKRTKRAGRPKGASIAIAAAYPERDEAAKRNFRYKDLYTTTSWEERMHLRYVARQRKSSDITYKVYTPVKRYKGEVTRSVDIWDVIGHSETFDTMDPLDLICLKETIAAKWDKLGEVGQTALLLQFSR